MVFKLKKVLLLLIALPLLSLNLSLAKSIESIEEALGEVLTDNQALGFVYQGELKILSPKNLHKTPFLDFYSTQMQEATAPMEVDLHNFEGEFVIITWQVGDGYAFWGVSVALVYQDETMDLPFR